MSVIPHLKPAVIERMPDEMFEGIQTALPLGKNEISNGTNVRWPHMNKSYPEDLRILDILEPCLQAIVRTEVRRIVFIELSVRNGLILPDETQSPASPDWHKDGSPFDKETRYVTANTFTTEFLGNWMSIYRPEPGDLVRFDRKKHRAPTNQTEVPIQRTWVRATVHHPE
jgi:hypothetical protein